MACQLFSEPSQSSDATADSGCTAATFQTRVWLDEHEWLYGIFRSRENTAPRFRLPDLLSSCVSLALASPQTEQQLVEFLVTRLTRRDPRCPRRSCGIWAQQYHQLLAVHKASWNRFPNPMFELDQITTACVAVSMAEPDGAKVLQQAR